MKIIKKILTFSLVLLVLLPVSQNIDTVSANSFYDTPNLVQSADLLSRIIFTGFDNTIMNSILTPLGKGAPSLLESNIYSYFSQDYTDKTFFINHSFELASSSFDNSFFNYLNDIAISDILNNTDGTSDKGRYINASATITWLSSNYNTFFGSKPIPGYTLIVANMSALDDGEYAQHWYNETYPDPDSKTPVRRSFMTGYGSRDRLYYLDLSADSYYLQNQGENSTLQDFSQLYNYYTFYGMKRFAEYLSEWIYEIERNLWVQDFVYAPLAPVGDLITGTQFYFDILVLTNISGYTPEQLEWTVNETYIVQAFKEVYPWISIDINLKFISLESVPKLDSIIQSSLVPWGTFNNDSSRKYGVDLIPIYEELYKNAASYLESRYYQFYTVHFKTFAFIFDDALFGIPNKAQLEPGLLGIALRDSHDSPLTIISHDFPYTYGDNRSDPKPYHGLSQTIIHELGHQIGLMHPFQFGTVGNFVDDVMAYYPHSSRFSIFSIDNIRRGQIDVILKAIRSTINQASIASADKVYNKNLQAFFNSINSSYYEILSSYAQMNYSTAYSLAKKLRLTMISFDPTLERIKARADYNDLNPIFFICMLFFFTTTIYYRGKNEILAQNQPKRDLMDSKMVDRLEKQAIKRFVSAKQAAADKIDELQKNTSKNDTKEEKLD
ncbi:MAG: hypothetical protein ACTSW1_03710 [Candidatus Hodarchaeales archaeon]